MVSVVDFGPGKGRGLVASSLITNSQIIFSEVPIVSIQFSWNKKYGYSSCEYCMKPLEDVTENLRRLTSDKSLIVPNSDDCVVFQSKGQFVNCTGCNEQYCSNSCLEKAWNSYHKLLCKSSNTISQDFLEEFESVWNSMHYPPESSNLMLIIKILAMLLQSDNRSDLMTKFGNFCQSTRDEANKLVLKFLNEKFIKKMEMLYDLFKENMYNDLIDKYIYTFDGFMSIVGLICRNSQGIATNTFSLWQKSVLNKYGETAEFKSFVDSMYEKIEEHVGMEFIDNEGIGLFEKQSLINHSCNPNCQIQLNGLNSEISILAIRDIKEGEELTISYLEENNLERSRHSRQKVLKDFYLFVCQCDKCVDEINDPDVTSEDESDYEDMDE